MPVVTPDTTPPVDVTVATAVLLLLHVPPEVASLNVTVDPTHTFALPVIAAGNGLTVNTADAAHPVLNL